MNDGVNDIQTAINEIGAGDVIMVSSGSFGGATVLIDGKTNFAIICPIRGQGTICELAGGRALTIGSTSTGSITINSLQIEGLLTCSGTGNNYLTNCQMINGITMTGTTGYYFFKSCDIAGVITVPYNFAGLLAFNQCNFAGATFALGQFSANQVQFALSLNLPTARPENATYGASNADTSQFITTNTDLLSVSNGLGYAGQVLSSNGANSVFWAVPSAPAINFINIQTYTYSGPYDYPLVVSEQGSIIMVNVGGGVGSAVINFSQFQDLLPNGFYCFIKNTSEAEHEITITYRSTGVAGATGGQIYAGNYVTLSNAAYCIITIQNNLMYLS